MSARFSGVVVGVVSSVEDPEKRGRIQVRYPWIGSDENSTWASVAAPMAGKDRGAFFMPEVDDEVLLAFEHGDFARAYVIGFMWNGVHNAPSEAPNQRMIRSTNGHTVRFVDNPPADGDTGALIIHDGHGNAIAMSNTRVVIKAQAQLELEAPQIILKGPGWERIVVQNKNEI
jgi:uncharacterized protein involved in type VI secretion and phage assembly